MASAINETTTANQEVAHPSVEIVQFNTSGSGDYYDCKKLRHVDGAFACQSATDGTDIRVSWAEQSNGVQRVTLNLETGSAYDGWLVIFGRL